MQLQRKPDLRRSCRGLEAWVHCQICLTARWRRCQRQGRTARSIGRPRRSTPPCATAGSTWSRSFCARLPPPTPAAWAPKTTTSRCSTRTSARRWSRRSLAASWSSATTRVVQADLPEHSRRAQAQAQPGHAVLERLVAGRPTCRWNWARASGSPAFPTCTPTATCWLPCAHPQNLAMDMIDDLEGVRLACEHVTDFYQLIYDDLYKRIAAAGQPATTWTNCLHQGRYYVSNCDFICMISPEQFQCTILPAIVRENEFVERNIFHLDGPAPCGTWTPCWSPARSTAFSGSMVRGAARAATIRRCTRKSRPPASACRSSPATWSNAAR